MRRNNRTWLCTVLFMDIVDYSTLSVDQQMLVKQSFSTLVSDALRSLPDEDCIKLDTGDGVAICYLGAPEDVLYVAIGLRDAFIEVKSICETCYSVRMGINLGPIKIIEDINGNRNTIGDGINVAQRIMSFSRPNQLLVSRAYYDVVSCLSDEGPRMFTHVGIHSDKHVREHDVYEVTTSKSGIQKAALFNDTPPVQDASRQAQQTGSDLDERILKIVQEQLARYIGPMAGVLLKRAIKKSSNLDELFSLLAEEIPTKEEKARFLKSRNNMH
jgi:class 3 adenylate cyclase